MGASIATGTKLTQKLNSHTSNLSGEELE